MLHEMIRVTIISMRLFGKVANSERMYRMERWRDWRSYEYQRLRGTAATRRLAEVRSNLVWEAVRS